MTTPITRGGHVVALALALSAAACGGKGASAPVGTDLVDRARPAQREGTVSGYLVASVGERSLGPFLARRGSGSSAAGLIAWVTGAEGASRRIIVAPIGPKGTKTGDEWLGAVVPIDTTSLVVGPLRGPTPGFLLAWTALTDRGKSLWTVAVGDDGAPRGKPVELARSADDIVWVDVVPTDQGALCLWAEETHDRDANLLAAALDGNGKVHGAPTRVARGLVSWHVTEVPGGAGVATIEAPPDAAEPEPRPARDARKAGVLAYRRLDAEGHETQAAVTITPTPLASGDVELAREPGGRLVVAWTHRATGEGTIMTAALDDGGGVVEPPRTIVEARGGAVLLSMASGRAGTAIAFESPTGQRGDARRVHVASLGKDLAPARTFSLDVFGRSRPEVAATETGFAVLATTSGCERGAFACDDGDPIATVFRADGAGAVVQREPLTFLSDPATLGWGMSCDGETCFTLAASPGSPARIRAVTVRPRANVERAVVKAKPTPAAAPSGARLEDLTAVLSGESVLDLATVRLGDATVVATLGSKPAGSARHAAADEVRALPATLTTRVLDAHGAPSAPTVISARALPAGGVALAPAGPPADGAALAWVSREKGTPQVHITRLDAKGRRTKDVQLATAKRDVTDVTITWAKDGWVVAWVDGRDGNGEVYATKLGADLSRPRREERITNAPGDASDLVALAGEDAVWLAWSDSRESPRDGLADVYVASISMHDAKRTRDEQRVLPTAAHSRTPHLAAGPDGVLLAWIEEAPIGAETPGTSGYGAFWARLDEAGRPVARPTRIPLAGDGAATAVVIEPGAPLRAVVARSAPQGISLDAAVLDGAASSSLLTLAGPPSLDVVLVLDGGVLYFNDDGPTPADRRARRGRVAWPPR